MVVDHGLFSNPVKRRHFPAMIAFHAPRSTVSFLHEKVGVDKLGNLDNVRHGCFFDGMP
jgi:hypothetical protein